MGSGGSVQIADESRASLAEEAAKPLDASDVQFTPRGEVARVEVRRLRALLHQSHSAAAKSGELRELKHKVDLAHNQGKPILILVLGGPGVGKSTVLDYVHLRLGFVRLSSEICCASEAEDPQSEWGQRVQRHTAENTAVPADLKVRCVLNSIHKGGLDTVYVMDGFPEVREGVSVVQAEITEAHTHTHTHEVRVRNAHELIACRNRRQRPTWCAGRDQLQGCLACGVFRGPTECLQ
jgi:adenylate kinase family enzyme